MSFISPDTLASQFLSDEPSTGEMEGKENSVAPSTCLLDENLKQKTSVQCGLNSPGRTVKNNTVKAVMKQNRNTIT